jgi:hypothetical protein
MQALVLDSAEERLSCHHEASEKCVVIQAGMIVAAAQVVVIICRQIYWPLFPVIFSSPFGYE